MSEVSRVLPNIMNFSLRFIEILDLSFKTNFVEKQPLKYNITAQKMKFSIKNFFSKCDQIRSFLRICSPLLKNSLMENFIFCAV